LSAKRIELRLPQREIRGRRMLRGFMAEVNPKNRHRPDKNAARLALLPSPEDYASGPDDPVRFYYRPFFGPRYRRRVELCLDLLDRGERILEVGFGSGVCFLNLKRLFRRIHGLDLQADCRAVKEAFAPRGIAPHLLNGSVTDLPYQDESFDAVLLISILEHLRPKALDAAMREIARVLRPHGFMVYGVPVERPLMRLAFRLLGYTIRDHHFSTEKDVFAAACRKMQPLEARIMHGAGRLFGPIYEVRRFGMFGRDSHAPRGKPLPRADSHPALPKGCRAGTNMSPPGRTS
jgi:SAM-dependent methyltransferase